jgi:AcrR family transcriptional regulator
VARTVGSAADDTRQRILDVAVELFIEQGFAGTSVRDISERLGMTKGSLYYHFASKEELLHALVTPLMDDLDAFIADVVAAGTVDRALVERLVNLLDVHGVFLRSLMGDPSVLHGLATRHSMPQRIVALQRALVGGASSGDAMRGRCALGVINAGTIGPRFDAIAAGGTEARQRAVRARLTGPEKAFVVDAALAVLAVSDPSPAGGPG